MSNLLLAIPKLSPDHIDLSVGEAHIVRDALFNALGYRSEYIKLTDKKCEYQSPNGYPALVRFLEDKHKAPIVITNGAKQAIGAVAYALHKLGKKRLGVGKIHWALIPPLIEAHNVKPVFNDDYDSYLAVLPNNPDGHMLDPTQFKHLANWHKDLGIPFINDSVYYSPIYLPNYPSFEAFGDVQIYSMSKYLGLSGFRIGYAVCPNEQFYQLIQEYMEMMTVGVSTVSQDIVLGILQELEYKSKYDSFIQQCQNDLAANKAAIYGIRSNILELPKNPYDINGMFLFAKCHRPDVFEKAKVNIANGIAFGKEGYIRMNLAVKKEVLIEVVERLNNV